jgi:hypothetical protein
MLRWRRASNDSTAHVLNLGRTASGISANTLHDLTFSRTVWRLYGGAKGLVMWYYALTFRHNRPPMARRSLFRDAWQISGAPPSV